MQTTEIKDFCNTEYLEFAKYVNTSRAIPSMVDGLKSTARKILFAALTKNLKDGKKHKMLELVGNTFESQYHHGDASLYANIMTLSSDWEKALPLFDVIGQGGSLRSPEGVAQPRYLSLKLSKYVGAFKIDQDLCESRYDDGIEVEPTHYLPLIPLVLTSNTGGTGVGYAFRSMSYNPINIIDQMLLLLDGKDKEIEIRPFIRGIKNERWHFVNDRWHSYGHWEIDEKKDIIKILELPHDTSYEDFENNLNWLAEREIIKDWQSININDEVQYTVQFHKKTLTNKLKEKNLKNTPWFFLKMYSLVEKDNLTCLTPNDKLYKYETVYELIKSFTEYRLTRVAERKAKKINSIKVDIAELEDYIKFIMAVIEGKLQINNRPYKDILIDLDKLAISEKGLSLKISKLTKEEVEKMQNQVMDLYKELKYYQEVTSEQLYKNDLIQFKKDFAKDFQ